MNLNDLVRNLVARGARFRVDDGRLVLQPPAEGLSTDEIELIRQHRDELISMLTAEPTGAADVVIPRLGDGHDRVPSPGQERLWTLSQIDDLGSAYNQGQALRLRGDVHRHALEVAVRGLVERHTILRSCYPSVDGVMSVKVRDPEALLVGFEDLRDAGSPAECASIADERINALIEAPYDLERGPLFRCALLHVATDDYRLVLGMHHIIADGWSWEVLLRDLGALYRAQVSGESARLEPLPLGYFDFAAWQRERLSRGGDEIERDLEYWKQQLKGAPALELPTVRARPAVQSHHGDSVTFEIDATLARALETVSRREGATTFMALLGLFHVLLARYSGQQDVVVGIPEAGRRHPDLEHLIGYFVNTLAVRIKFDDELTLNGLLRRVRENVLGAMDHADAPFDRIVNEVDVRRDLSRSPVFQAMFSMQTVSGPQAAPELADLDVTTLPLDSTAAMFDLTLWMSEVGDGYRCELEYNTDLFDREFVAQCARNYVALLDHAVRSPAVPVMRLPLTASTEPMLRSGTVDATLTTGSLLEWIREQVERSGAKCAIEDEAGQQWSYSELWSYAGRVASALAGRGVSAGDLVGVRLTRGAPMLGVVLGILRRGAAYLPLDPDFPADRLAYMVEDGGAALVISDDASPLAAAELVSPDALLSEPATDTILDEPGTADLAYVLYTSGSTGRPKGVEITHGALRNFLGSMRSEPGLGSEDVLLAVTTLSFDISGLELFLPLCVGGQVVIASKETSSDGYALAQRLEESGATVMQATPASWRMLVDAGWRGRLKKILCGGEALPEELARQLVERAEEVWNLYGPTETTIWSTVERIRSGGPVLVGVPIANTRVYVLDRHEQLVPDGVHGEIWIAGSGVARGYRNRSDLTEERFKADPFVPGERMYRTGDVGRWRSDGRLEHLGRVDFQVKVHGYRIELGEIESALEGLDEVKQAVVVARGEAEDRRLVAYVIYEAGRELVAGDVRRLLGQTLPQYMVPGLVVAVETMPLTPNGKVDRKALPDPLASELAVAQREYEAPQGEIEELIADVWKEVLGVERVSRHDNFFELGGHSLLAVRAATLVARATGSSVSPREFFFRSLSQLAATMTSLQPSMEGLLVAVPADPESRAETTGGGRWNDVLGRFGRTIPRPK